MLKKIMILFLLFLSIFFVIGCKTIKLEINGESTIEVGTSIVLTHNFDYTEDEVWSSSDTSIAEVFDGMVIANNVGTVTITLTIDDYDKKLLNFLKTFYLYKTNENP